MSCLSFVALVGVALVGTAGCEVTVEASLRFDAGPSMTADASSAVDGGSPQGGDGGGGGPWVACDPADLPNGSGHHNPGTACMECHGPGGTGPLFTAAGTAYTDALGSAPAAGASIRVRDANGQELQLITATNGNFWTSQVIAFPALVASSTCPNVLPMGPPVATAGANCNQGGCHNGVGNRIPVSQP